MSEWQPISTAPNDELIFIGKYNGVVFEYIQASFCMGGDWHLPFDSERDDKGTPILASREQPTHWCLIPDNPKD